MKKIILLASIVLFGTVFAENTFEIVPMPTGHLYSVATPTIAVRGSFTVAEGKAYAAYRLQIVRGGANEIIEQPKLVIYHITPPPILYTQPYGNYFYTEEIDVQSQNISGFILEGLYKANANDPGTWEIIMDIPQQVTYSSSATTTKWGRIASSDPAMDGVSVRGACFYAGPYTGNYENISTRPPLEKWEWRTPDDLRSIMDEIAEAGGNVLKVSWWGDSYEYDYCEDPMNGCNPSLNNEDRIFHVGTSGDYLTDENGQPAPFNYWMAGGVTQHRSKNMKLKVTPLGQTATREYSLEQGFSFQRCVLPETCDPQDPFCYSLEDTCDSYPQLQGGSIPELFAYELSCDYIRKLYNADQTRICVANEFMDTTLTCNEYGWSSEANQPCVPLEGGIYLFNGMTLGAIENIINDQLQEQNIPYIFDCTGIPNTFIIPAGFLIKTCYNHDMQYLCATNEYCNSALNACQNKCRRWEYSTYASGTPVIDDQQFETTYGTLDTYEQTFIEAASRNISIVPTIVDEEFKFDKEFPVYYQNLAKKLAKLVLRYKHNANWLKLYDQNGEARLAFNLLDVVHRGWEETTYFPITHTQFYRVLNLDPQNSDNDLLAIFPWFPDDCFDGSRSIPDLNTHCISSTHLLQPDAFSPGQLKAINAYAYVRAFDLMAEEVEILTGGIKIGFMLDTSPMPPALTHDPLYNSTYLQGVRPYDLMGGPIPEMFEQVPFMDFYDGPYTDVLGNKTYLSFYDYNLSAFRKIDVIDSGMLHYIPNPYFLQNMSSLLAINPFNITTDYVERLRFDPAWTLPDNGEYEIGIRAPRTIRAATISMLMGNRLPCYMMWLF